MAEQPPRKPKVPRRKELEESYRSLEDAAAARHRREVELFEAAVQQSKSARQSKSEVADEKKQGGPILHSPPSAEYPFGFDMDLSPVRPPDAVGINGLSSGVTNPSSSEPPRPTSRRSLFEDEESLSNPELFAPPPPGLFSPLPSEFSPPQEFSKPQDFSQPHELFTPTPTQELFTSQPQEFLTPPPTQELFPTQSQEFLTPPSTQELLTSQSQEFLTPPPTQELFTSRPLEFLTPPSTQELFTPRPQELLTPTAEKVIQVEHSSSHDEKSSSQQLYLQFSGLTYTVCKKLSQWQRFKRAVLPGKSTHPLPKSLRLLGGISGEARDGEILAIMGPSGSGKSTLIDALAQRINSVKGTMTLNGSQFSERLLRNISAYVMQDDLLYPMLTVKETLMFSAFFRLPPSQSKAVKMARVNNLLDQLGLLRVANTIIGNEGHRGVSGGERRRVSIGIDIVHDPLILFLDEPTSGLDSTSAYLVVRTLQKIAQTGSLVVLSIHQPSYRIMGLFNRLIILAFGEKVYGGPATDLNLFFEEFGRPVPKHENSTEHALDLIQELHGSQEGIKSLVEFCKEWEAKSKNPAPMQEEFHGTGATMSNVLLNKKLHAMKPAKSKPANTVWHRKTGMDAMGSFANPGWAEILVLVRRSWKNIKRTPELFLMRLSTVMITSFILATIFWHIDTTYQGVQERLGFFAFAMSTTYYTCADALPVFLQERYIFMRETSTNAYRKSSYVLAHAIIYVPFLAMLSMVFCVIMWWAVGLAGGVSGFFFFFLIVWASFWAGNSFVTLLSAIIPNVMLGYTIVVAILAYFLLLSGFFISRLRIPWYWRWFHYISIIKYPYEAVLINEFGKTTSCFEFGQQLLHGTPLAHLDESIVDGMLYYIRSWPQLRNTPYSLLSPTSCLLTGHDVLVTKEITELSKWNCLGITIAFGIFFRFAFYVVIRISGKNKRD